MYLFYLLRNLVSLFKNFFDDIDDEVNERRLYCRYIGI